ncbi:hypothetical protein [Salinisphaera sp. G21_0]|uniref:hypothetical protein n=1 Tax=Salinisphaera sp. G21_0 TaxID=2821094 RepID=UPI001ADCF54A|nr:hypothetical protein [Salinisphaera sp. G21_0]MBO9480170.1 hypothetical protein [Salinisphaera sp. G21_0]
MNSVPGGFVSGTQPPGYGATEASGSDVPGRFSGHDVVASQPCRLCAAPPPSYSEAMRQTPQAFPDRNKPVPDRNNVLLLNNVRRQMREDAFQVERRANDKGCCEQLFGNGCLGDLLQICCVSACMLTLSCLCGK